MRRCVPSTNGKPACISTRIRILPYRRLPWTRTTGGNTITYYYPLSIPYIQPNYAYTIGDVKIKRLGSLDPFTPVSTAECTFTVKVRDWDAGDIIGEFNNETSGDDFEI